MIPIFKRRLGRFGGAGVSAPVATITSSENGIIYVPLGGVGFVTVTPGKGEPDEAFDLSTSPTFDIANDGTPRDIAIRGDLASINKIWCIGEDVSDFDFSAITGCCDCRLQANNIVNISGLPPNADVLRLNDNDITDISPLAPLGNMTAVFLNSNPILYTSIIWATRTSGSYEFSSTVTTSGEVDQWLIDLNTASWSGCTTYLDGTNPARTADSDAAVAALVVLRGCTLHLN